MSISPFEILKADMNDVFDIYVNCILHDKASKNKSKEDVWVTSSNATWH
jgi:hypothetical protein